MRLIITADWHLRATAPRCRTDENWIETQKKVLNQICKYSETYMADVCIVGDIFHTNSDASFEIISIVQDLANKLKNGLFILAGNHDLPYHNTENINKSAIGILLNSENIHKLKFIHPLDRIVSASNFDEEDNKDAKYVFKHILTIPEEDKNPMIECKTPQDLLDDFPNADWIFTGDYHHNFVYVNKGRYVINPGCITRQVVDMKDYQCCIYFVDTEANKIEFLPLWDGEFIDDSYIIKENEREERIENFANKLVDNEIISLDFIENVKSAMDKNKLSPDLKDMINKLIGV